MKVYNLNRSSVAEMQTEIDASLAEMKAITSKAKAEGRDLSGDEVSRFDTIDAELRVLANEKSKKERHGMDDPGLAEAIARSNVDDSLKNGATGSRPGQMKSASGKPMVVAVGPKQRLSQSPAASGQVGEFARSVAIGVNNAFATPEVKMALTSDLNSAGGYSIPAGWLSGWIDRGIELTTVAQYCTRFMMDTADVNVTTLTSRPTAATKAELAKFSESGLTFGSSRLQAFTAGSSFLASLELLQDSPNAGQQIEAACMRGLIDWLNDTMLNGSGSSEPTGIMNRNDLPGVDAPGLIDWDMIADGVTALRDELYVANVCIMSPTAYNALHLQRENTGGDGGFLPRPQHLADLNIVQSSHCPETDIIMGDFTQLMFGVREDAKVEVSPVADEAFERNAVRIRLKVRCDWVPAHVQAFYRLTGVTMPA